jgi:ATP-dependent Lhr-like helicase
VSDTDKRLAIARSLLDRYGVVTAEAAHAEGIPGGYAGVYDVLKTLEDAGRVRRGYFVVGRGGALFAAAGADERLRALRNPPVASGPIVLAASDPANVWGALVDWPESHCEDRPQRAAGALVVVHDGALLGWLGRRQRSLLTFLPRDRAERPRSTRTLASALSSMVDGTRRRALLISEIDGDSALESDVARAFIEGGFAPTARGLLLARALSPQRALPEARGDGKLC